MIHLSCLNKAMAFLIAVASSRFPSTNNQLRTSSNPRNQATIQYGNVTVQQVQGRQGQSYAGTSYKGEGHMATQCTQPRRTRNVAWFKEKTMLAEAREARQILDEEQLAFLVYPGIPDGQTAQIPFPNTSCLSDEQAFWLKTSHPNIDQSASSPVKIEAPQEHPKVSMVNTSLKKLKNHLDQFDIVVKKQTIPDALTEGEWGFEHTKAVFLKEIILFLKTLKYIFNVFDKDLLNEATEVQTVFNQMEAFVQQKELFLENDRLLRKIMSQDVMICVMNSKLLLLMI
ncbi:hypothetical protein Tco_0997309 [Tanacetum coccineum]